MRKSFCAFFLSLALSTPVLLGQELMQQDPEKHVVRTFPSTELHLCFHSDILGCDKNFSVILPASYQTDPQRRYPVVYLLHGHGENDWEWANINVAMIREQIAKSVSDGMASEMIVVKPNATEYQSGYFNQEGWRYEDYFFQELIPMVEKHFRCLSDKGHRAIGGLSMGGGGAFYYGIRHPEMFSSVYAISAAVGTFGSGVKGDVEASRAIRNAQGQAVQELFNSRVDLSLLTPEQIKQIRTVAFTLDLGDDDFLFDANIKTYQEMKKLGLNCQLRVGEGTHASYYWYDALGKALLFWTRHFSTQCP